jgi:hypothetical protein
MNATLIRGTIRDGKVEVNDRIDLPEGTKVGIAPIDDDGPPSPQEIARVLAAMEKLEPFEMTPEEEAESEEWERQINEYTKANFEREMKDSVP